MPKKTKANKKHIPNKATVDTFLRTDAGKDLHRIAGPVVRYGVPILFSINEDRRKFTKRELRQIAKDFHKRDITAGRVCNIAGNLPDKHRLKATNV